jgi:uncharacterized lipoprotein YajG
MDCTTGALTNAVATVSLSGCHMRYNILHNAPLHSILTEAERVMSVSFLVVYGNAMAEEEGAMALTSSVGSVLGATDRT